MKIFLIIICPILFTINSIAQQSIIVDKENKQLLFLEYSIWKTQDTTLKVKLIFKKASLLKNTSRYNEACDELERIKHNYSFNQNEVNYQLALNHFLSYKYDKAYNDLLDIPDTLRYSDKNIKLLWLLILVGKHEWDNCKKYLLMFSDTTQLTINNINKLPTYIKYKSPVKASRMSSYLPGLGQIYAGYPLKGIISFSLNAGFVFLATEEYINKYFISGTVFGAYPFLRFYIGGRQLSYKLAIKHNETKENKLKERYVEVILKTFESK